MRALMVSVLAVAVSGCTFGIKTCTDTSECNPGSTCEEGFCVAPPDSGTGGGSTGGGAGGGTTGGGGGTTTGGGMGGGGGDSDGGAACALRTTSCPTGYECRETVPYEANCILAFESLALTVGDGGTALNTQAPTVNLQLVRKAGFNTADAPASVQVTGSGDDGGIGAVSVAGTGGVYSGSVAVGGDGTFSFVGTADFTNEDGGTDLLTSNRATVALDTTPPSLTWQPLDAGQYKRDDIIEVKVDSNEPVTGVTAWLNGVPLMNSPTCSGAAACFRANFSEPELAAMTATWQLTVAGNDLAGNVGDGGVATQVTRVRWVTQVPGGQDMRASPAVGPDGTIYVGTTNGSWNAGTLARLSADGAILTSSAAYGGVVSLGVSPAGTSLAGGSSGSVVFVVSNTPSRGELRGLAADLSVDAGVGQLPGASEGIASRKAWSGVAITRTSGNRVAGFATTDSAHTTPAVGPDNSARLLKWDSVGGSVGTRDLPQRDAGPVTLGDNGSELEPIRVGGSGAPTAVPVVISGMVATFVTRQPNADYAFPSPGLHLRKVVDLSTGTPALNSAVATLSSSQDTLTVGQAPTAGGSVVGTFTSPRQFHYSGSIVLSGTPAGDVEYGAASIGANGQAFFGAGARLLRTVGNNPMMNAVDLLPTPLVDGVVRTMPVLAKPMGSRPDTGYAITTTGQLIVFDSSPAASPGAARRWSASVPGVSSAVETHMAFDCNRRNGSANTTTGILYIPFLDGNVAAIIVDSPRLEDDSAAWPKYQRSMGNAGNDDTGFFPTNWACP